MWSNWGLVVAFGYIRSISVINENFNKNFKVGVEEPLGGIPVPVCNVAIFLRKLVTCTTMWAYPLGNPCIKTGGGHPFLYTKNS